jgi:hypothetical protein
MSDLKPPKPPKKSETLEIRLSHEAKAAFMARCRADGRSASEAMRRFIEGEINHRPHPLRGWRALAAAAAAGLAVGAAAGPSLAHPTPDTRAVFDRLDRNHDGLLSFEEFRGR